MEEQKPKEQRAEFWHTYLRGLGFWLDHAYIHKDSSPMIWYKKGDFRVGYDSGDINKGLSPHLCISHLKVHCSVMIIGDKDFRSNSPAQLIGLISSPSKGKIGYPWPEPLPTVPEILQIPLVQLSEFTGVVEKILVPENWPLLVGIRWASELVAHLLEGKA